MEPVCENRCGAMFRRFPAFETRSSEHLILSPLRRDNKQFLRLCQGRDKRAGIFLYSILGVFWAHFFRQAEKNRAFRSNLFCGPAAKKDFRCNPLRAQGLAVRAYFLERPRASAAIMAL
jgi:hypothetical protein